MTNKKLHVEIADTPSKREKGLMHRKHIGKNEGMLFKFPQKERLSFWMKNTLVPLDVAFIDDNGRIVQIESMKPMSLSPHSSSFPCRYALETNSGWFKSNGVKEGSVLRGVYFNTLRRNAQNMQMNTPQPNQPNQPNQQQEQQASEEVQVLFSIKEKVKYAEERGLKLRIIYISDHGHYIGPRVLSPVREEGNTYPVYHSSNEFGDYFKAYDESPTIKGNGWESKGGSVKSFHFSGVQKLDILDRDGNVIQFMRGQPIDDAHIEKTPETKVDEDAIKKEVRRAIPFLSEKQWEKIKGGVLDLAGKGIGIKDIVQSIFQKMLSFFPRPR